MRAQSRWPAGGDGRVRDVMRTGVVAAHEEAAFDQIVDAIVRNRISAVPVIDHERLVVGVVSESDLLAHLSGEQTTATPHLPEATREHRVVTAGELMSAPAVVTTPDTTLEDAARLCAGRQVRRLPVVDARGELVGIVTRADLLRPVRGRRMEGAEHE